MFDSSMYGLSNPALTEDIGLANLNRTLPMAPGFGNSIPGVTGTMDNVKLRGPLSNDVLEKTQKEKDKQTWKTIFTVGGLTILGALGLKFGKKGISAVWNGIKNMFSKIKPKKP